MTKIIKNMSASVHDRLLTQAKQDKRPFNELLQYFAMDRLLYRWSKSPHSKLFVLKGALMLKVWKASEIRPTMDIDMLGKTHNDVASIVEMIKDVISVEVEPDGLVFPSDSVTATKITEDADYEGLRINFRGNLGTARIDMQVDIGFGDIVYPPAQNTEIPAMLGFPPAMLLCYSLESSIAEKFEAAVSLGEVNSRMKDFFDIWGLSRQFDFNGEPLAEAIRLTFRQRGTELPAEISAFSKKFIELKQMQWIAFHKRLKQEHVPKSFGEIVGGVELFLSPIAKGLANGKIPETWRASGPWGPT